MDANTCGVDLSLVIPAFNEAAVIARAAREAIAALNGHTDRYEVLIVDDGSTDDTMRNVEGLCENVRVLRHPVNRGYGAALRTGFEAARYPFVAFTDADGQFDLHDLGAMVQLARDGAVVVGYRRDRKDSWRRRFLSRGYNGLARTLLGTGVRDVDCALKVFRRDVLAELLPSSRGFFVNTEMLTRARRRGFEVVEVPVTHRARLGGASKVSLWEVPRTLKTLARFWWQEVVCEPRPSTAVVAARVTMIPLPGRVVGRARETAPGRRVAPLGSSPGSS